MDIVAELREFGAYSNPGGQYERLPFVAADKIERLRAALGTIERMCSEEISARFGGHHSKTEEELAGKSVIYAMLVLPRNIARSALADEQSPRGAT